jgi:DNA repair photolyase
MIKEITAKSILIKTKSSGSWFNIRYNMNLYRGCSHKCIYCDSRSECYQIENFDDILVKTNAPELINKELARYRTKGTIGTGAMSDPYVHIEKKYKLTQKALMLIDAYKYPVTIITKSDLVLRDINILESINKYTQATVIFTITSTDDKLAKIIEPYAPLPSKRLIAMKELSDRGIYTGVLMMPILPFINDTEDNIKKIVKECSLNGASFIIPSFGVTLRDRQRDYYYNELDKHFPSLKEKYQTKYKNYYNARSPHYNKLKKIFITECNKYQIIHDMKLVKTWEKQNSVAQLNLFNLLFFLF